MEQSAAFAQAVEIITNSKLFVLWLVGVARIGLAIFLVYALLPTISFLGIAKLVHSRRRVVSSPKRGSAQEAEGGIVPGSHAPELKSTPSQGFFQEWLVPIIYVMCACIVFALFSDHSRMQARVDDYHSRLWPNTEKNDWTIEKVEWGIDGPKTVKARVMVTNQTDALMDVYMLSAGAFAEWYSQGGLRTKVDTGTSGNLDGYAQQIGLIASTGAGGINCEALPGEYVILALNANPIPIANLNYMPTTDFAVEIFNLSTVERHYDVTILERSQADAMKSILAIAEEYPLKTDE